MLLLKSNFVFVCCCMKKRRTFQNFSIVLKLLITCYISSFKEFFEWLSLYFWHKFGKWQGFLENLKLNVTFTQGK